MSKFLEQTKRILADHFGVDEAEITAESTFALLGADSLDTVELVMAFEEEFSIEISEEEPEKFQKVGDILQYLERELGDSPPPLTGAA